MIQGGKNMMVIIITYVLFCLHLYILGEKSGYKYKHFAFIPLLNIAMAGNISGMSGLLAIVLVLIPGVNIMTSVYLMYALYCSFENGEWIFIVWFVLSVLSKIYAPWLTTLTMLPGTYLALSDSRYREKLYKQH